MRSAIVLKHLLDTRDMNATQAAKALAISNAYMSELLHGKRGPLKKEGLQWLKEQLSLTHHEYSLYWHAAAEDAIGPRP